MQTPSKGCAYSQYFNEYVPLGFILYGEFLLMYPLSSEAETEGFNHNY